MKESPIIFTGHMVNAILEDRKSQTRRVIKHWLIGDDLSFTDEYILLPDNHLIDDCPYGQPGDRLWVRETFQCDDYRYPDGAPIDELKDSLTYRADHDENCNCFEEGISWRPSIFMPRWASRIDLELTEIRVERLQGISKADVAAEGISQIDKHTTLVHSFAIGWNGINGKRAKGIYAWERNPWVWALTFKRIKPSCRYGSS